MNKKKMIAIVLGLALIAGVGAYFAQGGLQGMLKVKPPSITSVKVKPFTLPPLKLDLQSNRNLVVDGDMEKNNMTNWTSWGAPLAYEKNTSEFFGGSRSTYLKVDQNGGAGIQQTFIPVVAGKTYTYSFRYKLISGTLTSDLASNRDNNRDFEDKRITKNVEDGSGWQLVEREFTVPADFVNADRFSVVIRMRSGDTIGEAYIDDVKIKPLNIENLVVDGDMEKNNMTNWTSWGAPLAYEKNTSEFFGGSRSTYLKVDENGGAGIQQMFIPVVAGKTYTYSFRYKLISGTLTSDLASNGDNNSDFEDKRITKNVEDGSGWQLVEREFTVPADFVNADRFSVVIRMRSGDSIGEAYIDDVVVSAK